MPAPSVQAAPATPAAAEPPQMRRIQPVQRPTFERPVAIPAPVAAPPAPIAVPRPPEMRPPEMRPVERRVDPGVQPGGQPGAVPGVQRERHDVRDMRNERR